jgi:RNA polymerase sigma-70 factor (ECF subfamily)
MNNVFAVGCALQGKQGTVSFLSRREVSGNKGHGPPVCTVESLKRRMPNAMQEVGNAGRFEEVVLPHLDAAYNLARWLVRNTHDAEDVVQEACLRAFKFFGGFQGGDPRAWLLKIVRNTSYSFLEKNRPAALAEEFDEQIHVRNFPTFDAEAIMVRNVESRLLRESLEELPVNFREVLVLRELEGLSYKEIAEMIGVPIGTVMSSLARGRDRLRESLLRARAKEGTRGL